MSKFLLFLLLISNYVFAKNFKELVIPKGISSVATTDELNNNCGGSKNPYGILNRLTRVEVVKEFSIDNLESAWILNLFFDYNKQKHVSILLTSLGKIKCAHKKEYTGFKSVSEFSRTNLEFKNARRMIMMIPALLGCAMKNDIRKEDLLVKVSHHDYTINQDSEKNLLGRLDLHYKRDLKDSEFSDSLYVKMYKNGQIKCGML